MTPSDELTQPAPRITLDDLKHRAESIKDLAVTDTKSAVNRVLDTDATKTLMMVAGVVLVAASFAYFLGTRTGRGSSSDI